MTIRGSLKAWAFAAAFAAGAIAAPAAAAEPLRVCADPDNLPFSKSEGAERGMYVELAELVGQQLNRPIEFVWWYTHNQRRALRNTITKNECDVVAGLPSDYRARNLAKSKPFLQVGYAVVTAPGYRFKSFDDLRSRRFAVQFGSTPHVLLNNMEGFRSVTYKESEQLFEALAKGEVDAAFMWGPVAGYENKTRHGGRWQVTPVAGNDLNGAVSMAVQRGQEALLADIDRALEALKPQILALATKYAFPTDKPVDLAFAAARPRAVTVPTALLVQVQAKADEAKGDEAKKAATGRVKFNDACSHCHGTDGYSPVRERDLRRLQSRYDAKWPETALATILNGRVDAGMPVWKDSLSVQQQQEIMAFLRTIQK